jgi:hypothetical protein
MNDLVFIEQKHTSIAREAMTMARKLVILA